VIGFSVWCQTGGWHAFQRRAFLDSDSVWIELNAAVAVRSSAMAQTVEEAVGAFFGAARAAGAWNCCGARKSSSANCSIFGVRGAKTLLSSSAHSALLHVYWDSLFISTPSAR